MIPLLRAFQAHAAKRGEGLRTEFFRHMSGPVARSPADVDASDKKQPQADNDDEGAGRLRVGAARHERSIEDDAAEHVNLVAFGAHDDRFALARRNAGQGADVFEMGH